SRVFSRFVERATPQDEDRGRVVDRAPVREPLDESLVPRLLDQRGHPVHGPLEIALLPAGRSGLPMEDLGGAVRVLVELVDRRPFGTETAFAVRAARIALDVHDLAVDRMDERGTADCAVGA